MQQISDEIAAEKQGLESRYVRDCRDAGFLMQAVENGEGPAAWTDRLDGLSASILRCERRLEELSSQLDLVNGLRLSLERELAVSSIFKKHLDKRAG